MQVRLATVADKDQILGLFDEFSAMLNAKDRPSQIGGPIVDEILLRSDCKIFVVEEGDKLVGVSTLYLLPNIRHGWHRGHIEDLFVSESARQKGTGTALFNAVREWCKANGIKVIKLDSGIEFEGAHKFYEKMGGKSTEKFFRFDL